MNKGKESKSMGEFLDDVSLVNKPLPEPGQQGWDDRVKYIDLVKKLHERLDYFRKKSLGPADTRASLVSLSVLKNYREAREISGMYSDPDGSRKQELDELKESLDELRGVR